ncbi:MAG: DUF1772 domain-containing protein [Blastocatellia bacterium]
MAIKIVSFLSLLFSALALAPALAHLLELPGKINLSRADYLTVQQIYRGWALLGIVVAGALFSTLALTIMSRHQSRAFAFALIALLGIIGAQVVFWTYTFPANQATSNWTFLPDNWQSLRTRWEYSHAAGAGLNLIALSAVIISVLTQKTDYQ